MKYFRAPAQRAGWLFVLATAAGVLSVAAMSSTLAADDLLPTVHANQGAVLLGHGLIFVMLTAMVGTAVLLYPILEKCSQTLAVGYALARTLEVTTISVGLIAGLLLVPLSWDAAAGAGGEIAGARGLADTLKLASDWTGYLGAQMVFSISALVLNWAFLRYRLLPRWLAVWGLIGVPLMFASGFLVMFESLNASAAALNVLVVPLAVQEMVMAGWLIVRGLQRPLERRLEDAAPRAVPSPPAP